MEPTVLWVVTRCDRYENPEVIHRYCRLDPSEAEHLAEQKCSQLEAEKKREAEIWTRNDWVRARVREGMDEEQARSLVETLKLQVEVDFYPNYETREIDLDLD